MSCIFGPVPSRRLGRSLGIDVIPAKTCSFDCIYCESGPTTHLSVKRRDFVAPSAVLGELSEFFRLHPDGTDVITFSSAGEPTLYSRLGELIEAVKGSYPHLPLIVLTNGSLLWDHEVRKDLLRADRVVPSLDAITPAVYQEINRPHPSLEISRIAEGIRAFRLEYGGQLHVEIVLASGVNDHPEELAALVRAVDRIRPDKVELNTVVRPPALSSTRGLSTDQMQHAARCFPCGIAEIVGVFSAAEKETGAENLGERILETIERRPCTISELAASLGIPESTVESEVRKLKARKKLAIHCFDGKEFLCKP